MDGACIICLLMLAFSVENIDGHANVLVKCVARSLTVEVESTSIVINEEVG